MHGASDSNLRGSVPLTGCRLRQLRVCADSVSEMVEVFVGELKTLEIKAFLPAKDFDISKNFYEDLGFQVSMMGDALAFVRHGRTAFFLQNFYVKEFAENLMMHLMVDDVNAWWAHVGQKSIVKKYGVLIEEISDKPWGLRDFAIGDPSGVLWRVAQELPA